MEQFKPIRRPVVERAVGALGVVKFYVSINALHELALRAILCPINLLPLHGGKEGLGYSIVMRTAGLRERFNDYPLECRKQLYEALEKYWAGQLKNTEIKNQIEETKV